jgi:hypothetical protein
LEPAVSDRIPLTDQQLDDITERANAATKGPWGFYDGDNYANIAADLTMTSRSSYSYREKIAQLEDENYWDDPAHEDDDESRASEQMAANAAFIAHARTDVDALVAEVRRLRTELATANARLDATARLAGRQENKLRELGTPTTVDVMSVTSEPETGTRPCGHDDYHGAHEWADRPGVWCPGIDFTDDETAVSRP